MDIGQKTLGQLSAERNEKKYVTLETAAKLSGYTKDYLERLCRLGKIEYRMWNNGQYVPELESLLRETHTILVSFEGVQMVNKEETTAASVVPSSAPVSDIPEKVSPAASSESKRDELTFVVRPVLSRVAHRPKDAQFVEPTIPSESKTEPRLPSVFGGAHIAVPVSSGEHEEWRSVLRSSGVVPVDRLPSGPMIPKVGDTASVDRSTVTTPPEVVSAEPIPPVPSPTSDVAPTPKSIAHPAIHLEVFDADTLAKARVHAQTPAPISEPILPAEMPAMAENVVASPPELSPEHHLVPVEPHPVTYNPTFNLALIALIAVGVALIGYFGSSSPSARTAQDTQDDLVATVAESFSDNVIVRDSGKGTITVTPVFKSGLGEEREFVLSPVQK